METLTGNSGGSVSPTNNNINTVGTGSITIVGNPGTSTLTTQLTGLTNHNVLVGAGSATITNVAPSATSGVPLISQGSSSDPTFGTAVVAGGGTGDTSFTAYSVICGGTTSTGNLQNVSGVGTTGQVLTSNGAAALPTWQTGGNIAFTDEATSFNALSQNGYYCTALLTATLPASPAQGDMIKIICDTSSVVTIQANTGQKIRIGTALSASAGTAASAHQGDAITLHYRSASTTWYAIEFIGTAWVVT